jgi:hypothetical protein
VALLLILAGLLILALAGWPGLLDAYPGLQVGLIIFGLFLSISGELLGWRENRSLKNQLTGLRPRSLSEDQRRKLLSHLAAHREGSAGFCSRLMDGESSDFAEALASTFREAGWTVVPHLKTSLNDFPGYLSVFVTEEGLDSRASIVQSALNSVGIECRREPIAESSIGGQKEPGSIYVVVGRQKRVTMAARLRDRRGAS